MFSKSLLKFECRATANEEYLIKQVNNWFINARRHFPRSGNKPGQQHASTGTIPDAEHPDQARHARGGSHRPTLTENTPQVEIFRIQKGFGCFRQRRATSQTVEASSSSVMCR